MSSIVAKKSIVSLLKKIEYKSSLWSDTSIDSDSS